MSDPTRAAADGDAAEDGTLLAEDHRVLFCAKVDARTHAAPGTELELAVHHRNIHLFDRESGEVLDGARRPSP